MGKGNLFRIQSYSIHDGPGIRTTIFLKGCPLHCLWCHNPESQRQAVELLYMENLCQGCGACQYVCPAGAVFPKGDTYVVDREKCRVCGACQEVCRQKARTLVGREATVEDVMEAVKRDEMFYQSSGGGVTVSGGEPLMQPEFTAGIFRACKERGIHTAVETSGYAVRDHMMQALGDADHIFYDIKAMEPGLHQRLTGVSNQVILENLVCLYHEMKKEVVVRIPVVCGCNDSAENFRCTGSFISTELGTDVRVQLLPYHSMGEGKQRQLGWQEEHRIRPPGQEEMEQSKQMLCGFGLSVQIGGSM